MYREEKKKEKSTKGRKMVRKGEKQVIDPLAGGEHERSACAQKKLVHAKLDKFQIRVLFRPRTRQMMYRRVYTAHWFDRGVLH